MDTSERRASHFRVTHMHFSQKHFLKFLPFRIEVSILQCKTSREKMNTSLTLNITVTYPKQGVLIWELHMSFSHKSITWNSYPFKTTWLSFKKKLLERKWTLLSIWKELWHILNLGFSFQNNTCAFVTKAFHEIFTLSNDVIIFQCNVSTQKMNTVVTSNNSVTYRE